MFKPLVEEFPCFGAVSYSLREKVWYCSPWATTSIEIHSKAFEPIKSGSSQTSHMIWLYPDFNWQQKLDFTLKVVGGDISSIPGVSDAIEVCAFFYCFFLFIWKCS